MTSRNLNFAGLVAAALTATLMTAGVAKAECALTIEPRQYQWLIQYDPFSDAEAQHQFDLTLVNRGDQPCEGRMQVDLRGKAFGLSRLGQSDRVAYALLDERAGTDVTPRSGRNARTLSARTVALAPGERSLMRFTFAASQDALASAGLYSQDAFISVESTDGRPLAERGVNLAVNVIPAAVMGLKGAFRRQDGVATINLGELVEGRKPLDTTLYVLSTGGYSVSVTSRNKGELRHAGGTWTIGYDLRVGSERINLRRGEQIDVVSRHARFDDYPLSVNIDSVADKRAGRYSDTLTFTVAAL